MNAAPSFFQDYAHMVSKPLALPLVGQENRPIYDADGKLVSITEHAPIFVEAVNFLHALTRTQSNSMEMLTLAAQAQNILDGAE